MSHPLPPCGKELNSRRKVQTFNEIPAIEDPRYDGLTDSLFRPDRTVQYCRKRKGVELTFPALIKSGHL